MPLQSATAPPAVSSSTGAPSITAGEIVSQVSMSATGQGRAQKAFLNAASIAQMLPASQMMHSGGSPYIAYPIVRYTAGAVGEHAHIHTHQILTANPSWDYGLQVQGHQLQSHQLLQANIQNRLMGNHNQSQISPALINSQATMHSAFGGSHHSMPLMRHPRSHVQPHPNALLTSLAVAQAYQANMAALSSSKPSQLFKAAPSPLQMTPGIYRDLAKDSYANDPDDEDTSAAKYRSFTVKLHRILADDEFKQYICWLPHGRSFKVLKQEEFEEKVIPLFYRHRKCASFMRQLNGWGFRRMLAGTDRNSYYHEMFLRGYPHLCAKMRRPLHKVKSTPISKKHPNFHDTNLFVELPKNNKEPRVIASVSTSPTNHDASSDSNGLGRFDSDTTNTSTSDGSVSDRGLNMSNLYGSSGGSEQDSNMYGSGESDQGSNLYAIGETEAPTCIVKEDWIKARVCMEAVARTTAATAIKIRTKAQAMIAARMVLGPEVG